MNSGFWKLFIRSESIRYPSVFRKINFVQYTQTNIYPNLSNPRYKYEGSKIATGFANDLADVCLKALGKHFGVVEIIETSYRGSAYHEQEIFSRNEIDVYIHKKPPFESIKVIIEYVWVIPTSTNPIIFYEDMTFYDMVNEKGIGMRIRFPRAIDPIYRPKLNIELNSLGLAMYLSQIELAQDFGREYTETLMIDYLFHMTPIRVTEYHTNLWGPYCSQEKLYETEKDDIVQTVIPLIVNDVNLESNGYTSHIIRNKRIIDTVIATLKKIIKKLLDPLAESKTKARRMFQNDYPEVRSELNEYLGSNEEIKLH